MRKVIGWTLLLIAIASIRRAVYGELGWYILMAFPIVAALLYGWYKLVLTAPKKREVR